MLLLAKCIVNDRSLAAAALLRRPATRFDVGELEKTFAQFPSTACDKAPFRARVIGERAASIGETYLPRELLLLVLHLSDPSFFPREHAS
jgi:hypothetical protein